MSGTFQRSLEVSAGDFNNAGKASRLIKDTLTKLGLPSEFIRRISVVSYEAEMNLIIHSHGGRMTFSVTDEFVGISSDDEGPGIGDISLAMTEGWSTASDEVRNLGFGAGMGLPNMKMNSDEFDIASQLGEGTHITMRFRIPVPLNGSVG